MAVAGAAFVMVASCRVPTTVEVRAETNLVYRSGLAAGPWGSDGFVGSLVVVPRGADDARLGVKVVLGVHHDARECRPPLYEGCIVARRSLRTCASERGCSAPGAPDGERLPSLPTDLAYGYYQSCQ